MAHYYDKKSTSSSRLLTPGFTLLLLILSVLRLTNHEFR